MKATTQLCIFDITDLYAILAKEESLDILAGFLLQFGYYRAKDIPIDAIQKSANIVITKNYLEGEGESVYSDRESLIFEKCEHP